MYAKDVCARQRNSEAIVKVISNLEKVNYDTVAELLPKLLVEGTLHLDPSAYKPTDPTSRKANGIGRYLIYDHPDKTQAFSIWAFAFASQQATSIHDHLFKGTVTVLEGPISEKYYIPTEDGFAKLAKRTNRYRFHTNSDSLDSMFIHQLKRRNNFGEHISVTLHIYEMEASLVNNEGEVVDNRNLNNIYLKDTSSGKASIPPYDDEYPDLSCESYRTVI